MLFRELIDDGPFAIEVRAGTSRLDDPIRWVHISDLPDPATYLRGGELILTNALWHHSPDDSRRFVRSLADKGAPAIGIALFGGQALPSGLAEACEEARVLLLVLPDVPFMDLTEYVISGLMREQGQQSVQAIALDSELAQRVAAGDGTAGILEVVTRVLGADCWALEMNGKVHALQPVPLETVAEVWSAAFGAPGTRTIATGDGRELVVVDLVTEAGVDGPRMAAVFGTDEATLRAHSQVSTDLLGRYLPIVLRAASRDRRAVDDLTLAAADAGVLEPGAERRLLEHAGIAALRAVIVCDLDSAEALAALEAACRLDGWECIAAPAVRGTSVALLGSVAAGHPEPVLDVEAFAENALRVLAHLTGKDATLGIAPVRPGLGTTRLITEATQAMLLAADSEGGSWATVDRVAPHRLLLATAGADLRQRLQDHLLGPIVEYDRRHGADLLKTLVAYFATDCSWKDTADSLHVHVNTLRYRIEKVQELTHRDLRRTDDRLDVLLALRAREFDARAEGS